jgi:hypothetical protein
MSLGNRIEGNQAAAVSDDLLGWLGRKALSEEVMSQVKFRYGRVNHHLYLQLSKLSAEGSKPGSESHGV